MVGDNSDRVFTRSNSTSFNEKDEQNVQKLVEKILTNEELLDKLISAIMKRVDEHYNAKLEKLEEKLKVVEKS